MKLPRMPATPKGWYDLVAREKWTEIVASGSGRGRKGGQRREYIPPPEVMALIEAQQRGELPPANPPSHEVREPRPHYKATSPPSPDYAAIPLYDVRAAAGGGAVVDHEHVVDFLHFKQEWIRQELRASPNDLYLIYVDGESMEPTLRPGDVILVDHRDQAQARDGVYVLRLDGTLLVKRLQKLPGGIIEVTSDNPAYKSFTLKLSEMKEQDFDIIGRVVWTGRRM